MRPKPLIPTLTVMSFSPNSRVGLEAGKRSACRRLGGDPEPLIELLVRGARAEAMHADEHAVGSDEPVPSLADCRLYGDLHPGAADHRGLVVFALRFEEFDARH